MNNLLLESLFLFFLLIFSEDTHSIRETDTHILVSQKVRPAQWSSVSTRKHLFQG